MSRSDRPSWLRRSRARRAPVEVAPEIVVEQMEQATQRLRDEAWKISATTRTPLIPEAAIEREPEPAAERRARRRRSRASAERES